MLIFFDKRLVFLATPKAGSTAVEAALESLANVAIPRPSPLKHTTVAEFERHIRPWLEEKSGSRFTTLALMREPVDWLRSWYRFRLRDDGDDPDHPMKDVSFERFSESYCDPQGPAYSQVGRQSDYVNANGAKVDKIFRYEDMELFTEFLEDRLDCIVNLPRINVPPAAETVLSPEGEARLHRAMSADRALYASLAQTGSED